MKIEACVTSLEEALAADQYGFDRIELCSALPVGGVSPSLALIEECSSRISAEVHVLIRPREGNFTYSPDELTLIQRDIEVAAAAGVTGVVFGVLDNSNRFDHSTNKMILEVASSFGLEATYHRAMDSCENPTEVLTQLIQLGFTRVLTSGKAASAVEGIDTIESFCNLASGKIQIMAGGGVNEENALQLKGAGVDALHFSIRKCQAVHDQMGATYEIDHKKIQAILSAIGK